jgi:hypothetical protein
MVADISSTSTTGCQGRCRLVQGRLLQTFPERVLTGLLVLSVDIDLGQAVPGDWVAEQLDFMLAWELGEAGGRVAVTDRCAFGLKNSERKLLGRHQPPRSEIPL